MVLIKKVPANICGEYYLSDEISGRVSKQAESAVTNNAEVEILRYAA